ncbi:gamma-glutamylcyclotransferase [Pseudomaricurvus alkylphenolicus]|uniref:gamma-glutamylcyclotransferase n=1 Tax=Pseudomaricurvus alkylphenolicus TaxID=1306991 RepID=UPI0014222237|nr:gamma-glutamylcyclotransferase [Pseudomaricurvus alkylphenolicus]
MTANTIEINRLMADFDPHEPVWVFGYGSLIYKVDFPYLQRRPASIRHYARRFWQGSHDHRGTPDSPGRVVTLIEEQDAHCGGVAYLITPGEFEHLDYREKNGYLRVATELTFDDGNHATGVVYIAREDNGAFLGPAPERDIAQHIASSQGPSGHNSDYLTELAQSLRELCYEDEHVFRLEKYLAEISC